MATPFVAIVGRPNVGKSTLFNRLVGERRAIVDAMPGLTRDRLYGQADWRGRSFVVVDTAGLVLGRLRDEEVGVRELRRRMEAQTQEAVAAVECVLFVVDAREGLNPIDRDIAELLRRSKVPVIVVANKIDTRGADVSEFYALGLGEVFGVSALHGTGSGDLLDAVVERLPAEADAGVEVAAARVDARVAVLGRPNVGKSSLVNALLGHERSLVDAVPGTTRDPVDTTFTFSGGDGQGNGRSVMLVDTAGIRRPGLTRGVEQYSLLRGLRAMERADVALVVMDAREGVTAQDRHIAGYVVQAGRGLVLVVNKWDLLSPEEKDERVWRKRLKDAFDFAPWAPVAYVSAKTGQRADLPLSLALQVVASRARRVSTPELNRWLRTVLAEREPPSHKGKRLTVLYVNQVEAGSPTFLVFVNDPELVHFSYQRFLESRLRKAFGFEGTPVRLLFRGRGKGEDSGARPRPRAARGKRPKGRL
ncbi:MAG TPA: ribosome biogenesis GTPase Der [Candidatus Limnocylindria bacterium]|nr:ribosome biogenesis GTPase Der [Candidatus Limnocylindria bacterium]